MRYLTALICLSGLFAGPAPAQQGEPAEPFFRVEVVLFAHADGRSDRRQETELEDFSSLVDPLRRARAMAAEAAWLEAQQQDEEILPDPEDSLAVLERIDALESGSGDISGDIGGDISDDISGDISDETEVQAPIFPETFLQLEQLSPTMANAWRRLSDSASHLPLGWRAWYQPLSRERVPPRVRLHDDEIIRLQWLDPARVFPDSPGRPLASSFDLSALLPEADYRLDGSFRLRLRQFMHVELDLSWREPLEPGFGPLDREFLETAAYEVHRLVQSRTVRSDRLEYFDSALFGVLVLIQPWEPTEAADSRTD